MAVGLQASAQTFTQYTTTEQQPWQTKGKVSLSTKAKSKSIHNSQFIIHNSKPFRAWGTCFNELDLDAIRLLTKEEQEKIMHDIFAPDGDLRFTRGRLTMNANDYSRAWYSCDTVAGDFALKYFNIEHDKENVIQLIKMAQRWQPAMTFWVSPWSPPSWMKINQDYCVVSSPFNTQPKEKDYLLFSPSLTPPVGGRISVGDSALPPTGGTGSGAVDPNEMQFMDGQRGRLFPKKLATQNYFIQDPRYLQAYANMFCKFIDLYAEENIPIDMVMYQNEAYSYTPYPGCAWTAEGTIRFNKEYLAPTLREKHPEVKLYVGTFNTNRQDYVEKIVSGLTPTPSPKERGVDIDATKDTLIIQGIGFQWEGRENLDFMREHHPDLHMVSSESECGNGQMDWRAGEHTFYLLHEYIGRGCDEYYNWNFILCDQGRSAWGWKQNALIQVDKLTSTQVDKLTSTQVDKLTSTQVDKLTSTQVDKLTSTQVDKLDDGDGNNSFARPNGTLDTSRTRQLVNSSTEYTYRYTPEYYAYKHFSHFVEPGSTLLAFYPIKDGLQAIVFQRPDGKRVVICGNTNNEAKTLSIGLNGQIVNGPIVKYLNVTLAAHSFNTFVEK